ncbi:MAG: hypothetical protein ACI4SS_03310 [Clostridia bacterium]
MKTVKIFNTIEFLASGNSLKHYGLTPCEPKGSNLGTIVTAALVNLPEGVTVENDHFCLDGEACELYETTNGQIRIRTKVHKSTCLCHSFEFNVANV